MASYPPVPYPPVNPYGSANQNLSEGNPVSFPHSPTFSPGPHESANQNSTGNHEVSVPQLPYSLNPYRSSDHESSINTPPPPYPTVLYGGNDQVLPPPPYQTVAYGSSDPTPAENHPPLQPPPPGFYECSDQNRAGISLIPQLPCSSGPSGSRDQETDGNCSAPGFQLLPGDADNLVDENEASAPPLSSIEKIPGYEHVAFDYAILAPPAPSEWPERQPVREDVPCLHKFSKQEVEDAVRHYASEHCCYGDGVAKKMEVTDIIMSSVYHYILETFGEKRESAWCFEPYKGQIIDGPQNGQAPGPWEIVVHPKQYFKDSKTKMEIPHTAFVKPCHGCASRGNVRCGSCMGRGSNQCHFCHGRRRRDGRLCTSCHGSGHKRCMRCHGRGTVKCRKCDGSGKLRGYLELSVTWANHFDYYISETSTVPKNKIRKVTGQVAFEEKNPKVWPLTHCADQNVNEASSNLVAKHTRDFPDERILQQHHSLQIVPIGKCSYSWKNRTGDFCVYGFQQKVYFPDYPQKCCCGCIIL